MVKFEPSELEKTVVYENLPCKKEVLPHMVAQGLVNCSLTHAKSIVWNMKRTGNIYTFKGIVNPTQEDSVELLRRYRTGRFDNQSENESSIKGEKP